MTSDEHRAMCLEAMEIAYDATRSSKPGAHRHSLAAAFYALAGIARVNPIEATNDMIDAAWRLPCIGGQEPPYSEVYRVMSANGDLTNAQEKEP